MKLDIKNKFIDLSIIIIALIYILFLSFNYQQRISFNESKGWDGARYYKFAEDIIKGEKPSTTAPFVFRAGVPTIVGLISNSKAEIIDNFFIVNLVFSILNIFILYYLFTLFKLSRFYKVLFTILYLSQWHAPLRFIFFIPIEVDSIGLSFLFINIILLDKIINENKYYLPFVLTSFCGMIFRDFTLVPALVYLIYFIKNNKISNFFTNKNQLFKHSLPLLSGLLYLILIRFLVQAENSYFFAGQFFNMLYSNSFIKYLHSVIVAFGPMIFLILLYYKTAIEEFKQLSYLKYYIIIIFIGAFIAGGDWEHYLFWFAPIFYYYLFKVISKANINLKYIIFVILPLQLISQRAWLLLPDYTNYSMSIHPFSFITYFNHTFSFFDLSPYFADPKASKINFVSYIVLFILLFLIDKKNELRMKFKESI